MTRLDRIKNLTGLAECFGQSQELQERCNLILVAGKLRVEESGDKEECDEIIKLYDAIEKYKLHVKSAGWEYVCPKPIPVKFTES